MTPIEEYRASWTEQSFDSQERVDPYKKFVFIAEGVNTEFWYFKEFIKIRKELGFSSIVDVSYLYRTKEDLNVSAPIRLIDYADQYISDHTNRFKRKTDRIIIVFDADHFVGKPKEYERILKKADEHGFDVGVTNPNFELFLLLHARNAFENFIRPNTQDLLRRKRPKEHRQYSSSLFKKVFHFDSKSNVRVGELAKDVFIAIEQEKLINQVPNNCLNQLTSNIGAIIEMIYQEGGAISKSRRGR